MRIIFMGTPALAVPCLDALRGEHEVVGVVTQPDKMVRVGRQMQLNASPVKTRALALNLPVFQPERARDEAFVQQMRELRPDAIAVVAYGQILSQSLLDIPAQNCAQGGCINVHFSLLPRWRGAAPVQRAIQHGDENSGVTTQWMVAKLDAGDVLLQESVKITSDETSAQLLERLTPIGARLLRESLGLMRDGRATRTPQDETQVTIAPTIQREEARIEWNNSAQHIENAVRAFVPWPVAWCLWRGEAFKIHTVHALANDFGAAPGTVRIDGAMLQVATGNGTLELLQVQPMGKSRLNALDWARGARLESDAKLD